MDSRGFEPLNIFIAPCISNYTRGWCRTNFTPCLWSYDAEITLYEPADQNRPSLDAYISALSPATLVVVGAGFEPATHDVSSVFTPIIALPTELPNHM